MKKLINRIEHLLTVDKHGFVVIDPITVEDISELEATLRENGYITRWTKENPNTHTKYLVIGR